MASRKVCGRAILVGQGRPGDDGPGSCGYERAYGLQQCRWHWLLKQPADVQARYATARSQPPHNTAPYRARVPKEKWPTGERWCAGCQSFVPMFYTSGSRCKACASSASHEAMVAKTYGLEPGEYDALLALQDGRCYVCRRRSPSRRLAVDHDHETGAVRGLLCPDPDRGCNHKVLGPLEANAVDSGLDAARRLVAYLEDPPYARLKRQLASGVDVSTVVAHARLARRAQAAEEASRRVSAQPPPF